MDEVIGGVSAKFDHGGCLETKVRLHLGDEAILKDQKWWLF